MSGLRIVEAGPRTTLQDAGRQGCRRHGLAAGGAADRHAWRWANKLLDNPLDSACMELMLGGFEAVAAGVLQIAMTGADAPITINGERVDNWASHRLEKGDRLKVGYAASGRILYLGLRGGIDGPARFGSRSVVAREQIEGLRPLQAGDTLAPLLTGQTSPARRVPDKFHGRYTGDLTLRLIGGYQNSLFHRDDLLRLTTSPYRVSNQSDRMGFRLEDAPLGRVPEGILSEGIAVGSVQVPGDGNPIVLLNDCQTIGGYPKPGAIGLLDVGRLAQRQPGQTIRFVFDNVANIQGERMVFEQFFKEARWNSSGTDLHWASL